MTFDCECGATTSRKKFTGQDYRKKEAKTCCRHNAICIKYKLKELTQKEGQ